MQERIFSSLLATVLALVLAIPTQAFAEDSALPTEP